MKHKTSMISLILFAVCALILCSCAAGQTESTESADASEPDESDVSAESSEPETDESSGPAESSEISEPETSKDITEYGWYYAEYTWYYDGMTKPEDYLCSYYKHKLQRFDFLTGHQNFGKELVSNEEIKTYCDNCGLTKFTPEYQKCCIMYRIIKRYNVDKEEFRQNIEAWRATDPDNEPSMEMEFYASFTDEEIDVLFGDDEEAVKQTFKKPCVLYYNGELYHCHELCYQTGEETLKTLWDAGVLEPFIDEMLKMIELQRVPEYVRDKLEEIKAKFSA